MRNRNIITLLAGTVSVLACFAVSPAMKAGCPNPPGVCGGQNTAVGENALFSVTTGVWNVGVGVQALFNDTDGNQNTGVGYRALFTNVSGDKATAIGAQALFNNTIGNDNVAIGFDTLFSNIDGNRNSGMGFRTLAFNASGNDNTAIGWNALFNNRGTASFNTAMGSEALLHNNSGTNNTAVGAQAMENSAGGSVVFNTAVGFQALQSTTANANAAFGDLALINDTSGFFNTAVGAAAGFNQTTGHNNIYIGQGSFGVAGESNTCYIQEIFGSLSSGGAFVFVNSAGKLGTTVSSKRFKDDIKPMDKSSEALFALKPVTFRYKKEIEPQPIPQWGLVAEDVEKVNPDLIVRDADGKVNTVRYDAVYNMMLNEFLKEHKKVQNLEATVAQQAKGMEALTTQLKEQAAQIQKVSAQLEMNKPAPQVVVNKP